VNYLAHFHLAAGSDGLIIGGLLGDFVKGPLKGAYPAEWERGIALHRRIDGYTDRHPALKQSSQHLFPDQYQRFAGIMLDVLFDHFLSRHWQRFHATPLPQFSSDTYQILASADAIPGAARQQANNLTDYQVLENFRHWHTVTASLERIGQRIRRDNPMASAAPLLEQHYQSLEQLFFDFYPQAQAFAQQVRTELAQP
jgi:acyl carrier protein phosphodiesterase